MLHVTCDVIGIIAQYLFEIQAAMYFELSQNFKLFQVDLHLKTFETELKRF